MDGLGALAAHLTGAPQGAPAYDHLTVDAARDALVVVGFTAAFTCGWVAWHRAQQDRGDRRNVLLLMCCALLATALTIIGLAVFGHPPDLLRQVLDVGEFAMYPENGSAHVTATGFGRLEHIDRPRGVYDAIRVGLAFTAALLFLTNTRIAVVRGRRCGWLSGGPYNPVLLLSYAMLMLAVAASQIELLGYPLTWRIPVLTCAVTLGLIATNHYVKFRVLPRYVRRVKAPPCARTPKPRDGLPQPRP